tara:strand:- start:262 stop:723 length:462 start_codon:yes stop_codon:yes gene_type:complete
MEDAQKIDRQTCKQIRGIITDNLSVALEQHCMEVKVGNGTYNSTSVTFKVTISLEGAPSPEEQALAQKIQWLNRQGLPSFDSEKVATYRGDPYVLTGFSSRSPKYPFLARRFDNDYVYKFTYMQAKELWGTEALGYENSEAGKAVTADMEATT